MRLRLTLAQKGIVLVCVPLLFELCFVAILAFLLHQSHEEREREILSKRIIGCASDLIKMASNLHQGPAGYVVTGSEEFVKQYNNASRDFPIKLQELDSLLSQDPHNQVVTSRLRLDSMRALDMLAAYKESMQNADRVRLLEQMETSDKAVLANLDSFTDTLSSIMQTQHRIEDKSPGIQAFWNNAVTTLLILGTLVNVGGGVWMALLVSRGIVSRLNVMSENANRLARGEVLMQPLSGDDEIAQLDGVFHQMAGSLSQARENERAVLESTLDVMCKINAEGLFTAVSPACVQVWQYNPDELIGAQYVNLITAEYVYDTRKAINDALNKKTKISVENCVLRKDGRRINMLWSLYWVESEKSVFCVAQDITRLKKAEEAFQLSERRTRAIIDTMPLGLLIVTKEGYIESANPQMKRIFGFDQEELLGKNMLGLLDIVVEDFRSFLELEYSKAVGEILECRAKRSDGTVFPVEISVRDFFAADGPRYLALLLDVSERWEVERLKREFVSIVSHELRTPLASISASLQMLSAGVLGKLPDKAARSVQTADRNTVRLISLINDILDLQKLESGNLRMVKGPVQVCEVVERSADAVRSFAEQKKIALKVRADSDAIAYADAERLIQVLVNLLSNATKFSPEDSQIDITAEENSHVITFRVEDRGRGIPEKFRERIFNRFEQVEQSDDRKKGGTGLGLAICKAIVEQHDGTIGVDSVEGKGSTFWFTVPKFSDDPDAS